MEGWIPSSRGENREGKRDKRIKGERELVSCVGIAKLWWEERKNICIHYS
jgi:hypothetical protein